MIEFKEKIKILINNESIFSKLEKYVQLILEKNLYFNLTGFNEYEIWVNGIYQSIIILNRFIDSKDNNINLLDIGAGAGFPSIPYYIFMDDKINLTIYEPIKKRCDFLNLITKELLLKNVKIINKRIEDENNKNSKFNFITARAVMPLNMLIEISSKCGQIGAKYIFLKSKEVYNELEKSKWIINNLKIKNLEINNVNIDDDKIHNIVCYTKTIQTPKIFPRKWSDIKKSI